METSEGLPQKGMLLDRIEEYEYQSKEIGNGFTVLITCQLGGRAPFNSLGVLRSKGLNHIT